VINGCNPARFWMHTNMLTLNGKKMSKSLDNHILPAQIFNGQNKIFDKSFDPNVVKFFIYQAHYRSVLDLSNEALLASEKGFKKLISGYNLISELKSSNENSDFDVDKWILDCYSKLNDDFNTPMLIAHLFDCVKYINNVNINSKKLNTTDKAKITKTFDEILFDILGFNKENEKVEKSDSQKELIELLIKIRSQARNDKNFELSDQIRDELLELGIKLNDDKNSSSYELI
jgi:cysteinyl-tRNA synthetase